MFRANKILNVSFHRTGTGGHEQMVPTPSAHNIYCDLVSFLCR